MKFKVNTLLRISITSIVFFFLILLFTLIICLCVFGRRNIVQDVEKVLIDEVYYKYTRVDSINNKTMRSIIRSNEKIQSNFIFSGSEAGVLTLVSNFGGEEFMCSGSCYCGISDRRSFGLSKPYVVKGLLYLASALSSAVAYNIAMEYFEEECTYAPFDEKCQNGDIHAEVEECHPIDVFEETSTEGDNNENKKTTFQCEGRCSPVNFGLRSGHVKVGTRVWEDFDEFYMEPPDEFMKHMHITHGPLCNNLRLEVDLEVERVGSFEYQEMNAVNHFAQVHLHKFCKSNSFTGITELTKMLVGEEGADHIPKFTWDVVPDESDEYFGEEDDDDDEYEEDYDDDDDDEEELSNANAFAVEVFKNYMENTNQEEGMSVCRSRKQYLVLRNFRKGKTFINVVCHRVFTPEEWEKGIPQQHNNQRHWKEGWKRKPDELGRLNRDDVQIL